MTPLWIALGAAVGAPLRYLLDRAVSRHTRAFPWGTLAVNVTGSFLLGFVVALPAGPVVTASVGTGLCGALTTYSTLSYESLRLARDRAPLSAGSNLALNVLTGLGAVYCGLSSASML